MTPTEYKLSRQWLGLTQEGLARLLGVSWNTVARWEGGTRRITERAANELTRMVEAARQQGGEG